MINRQANDFWMQIKRILQQSVSAHELAVFNKVRAHYSSCGDLIMTVPEHTDYLALGFHLTNLQDAIRTLQPGLKYEITHGQPTAREPAHGFGMRSRLQQSLTFDNFVLGNSNRRAWQGVWDRIGEWEHGSRLKQPMAPLVLYGSCGVGKTHLLYALANQVLEWQPELRVQYEMVPSFFQKMSRALKDGTVEEFRRSYSELDVLLIDDVQQLEGKTRTQEELLHIYGDLVEKGPGLLVMTSNRKLTDFGKKLEVRLLARLKSALAIRMEKPDLDTLRGILRLKSQILNLDIPEDCAERIVASVEDARSLQGVLEQVQSRLRAGAETIDQSMVDDAISEQIGHPCQLTPEDVVERVAKYYNVPMKVLHSSRQTKRIVNARQVSMYLLRKLTEKSYPEIGEIMGGRNHSTVMHACKKIAASAKTSATLRNELSALEESIQSE